MNGRLHFSPHRVAVIALNTWLEAVRQRFFVVLLLMGTAVVASALMFREFNFGASELKFVADFAFGALGLFGSILAIVGPAQLFFSELDNRTVWTVLARPVLRGEYLLGKFVGAALMIVAFVAVVGAATVGVLWWRERSLFDALTDLPAAGAISLSGVFLFAGVQALKFLVLAAVTFAIASYARTYLFTVMMAFVVLIICHLQPLAHEVWSRSSGWLARAASGTLALVFPNFQMFNLGDEIAAGRDVGLVLIGPVAGYGLIYLCALLAVAVFSFGRREI